MKQVSPGNRTNELLKLLIGLLTPLRFYGARRERSADESETQ
jgi:hypothetical protein